MPNTKEIKDHMGSVRDTQKITNAMYLIASTKLQKARRELDHTRPFFDAIHEEIKRIFRVDGNVSNRYFYDGTKEEADEVRAVLVITADKGLAGSYNQGVIKEAQRLFKEHNNCRFFVVGEYGRTHFAHHGIDFEQDFLFTAADPTLQKARDISGILLEEFLEERADSLYVIYTDMKSAMESQVVTERIIPFYRTAFCDDESAGSKAAPLDEKTDFEFYPSLSAILDGAMPSYLLGYIYSALVDSFCSEQNARMSAMDSANRNAEGILSDLTIKYNRVRQASITQEITEVTAGAKAQKKKRKKQAVDTAIFEPIQY